MEPRIFSRDFRSNYFYSPNKKSPPSNTPSLITFTDSDLTSSFNANDFNLVCVVRTDGSRNSPNGRDVLNNW